jgi:hypothetical protein
LRFPGQYYDEETGLHYNWHRYYKPEWGRYVEADPLNIGSMQLLENIPESYGGDTEIMRESFLSYPIRIHLYTFATNNPIEYVDPFGLFHYKQSQPEKGMPVEPVGPKTEELLRCMDRCLGRDLGISGGSEREGCGPNRGPCHTEGSAHYEGNAADISKRMNPGLDPQKVMCCAKRCGAKYAAVEGDHYHVQVTPSSGGSLGDLPKCGCKP